MEMYPVYLTDGCLYPALFHEVLRRDEYTYRGATRVDVEREYVKGLKWSPKHGGIRPTKSFLKDVTGVQLVCTDDLDRFLRQKKTALRD